MSHPLIITALVTCLLSRDDKNKIFNIMPHAYWGPEYNDNDLDAINEAKLS